MTLLKTDKDNLWLAICQAKVGDIIQIQTKIANRFFERV